MIKLLQARLNALNDLALTLKHVHWNVNGPNFIAVHTMLDPQLEAVRAMADATAERIAALGGSPYGTPGALVSLPNGRPHQRRVPPYQDIAGRSLLTAAARVLPAACQQVTVGQFLGIGTRATGLQMA